MGVLNSCWNAIVRIIAYTHVEGNRHGTIQQPLRLPEHGAEYGIVPSGGVEFTPQGAESNPDGTQFTCQYPTLKEYLPCNGDHRSCWLQSKSGREPQFDVYTDYENLHPQGVIREYWLNVSVQSMAPDGYLKPLGQVFNNSYPGPHLQGCWGDEFIIHVTNLIPNLGTTVHWHGIRQLGTNQQDGVNGVTQCPIAYKETYTYHWKALQYGHTWYHSHYQTQYSDGVMAPLTIYGPSSAEYDETTRPILMNDWVHENTSVAFRQELSAGIPVADSLLLGGTGTFLAPSNDNQSCSTCGARNPCPPQAGVNPEYCCKPLDKCTKSVANWNKSTGGPFATKFVEGKRYLLKLINGSAGSSFIFMIDEHDLEIIATDLVPIEPYSTDSIFIGIGQRYQIVVQARPRRRSPDNLYWIRTRIARGCGSVAQGGETTGMVFYGPAPGVGVTPHTLPRTERFDCEDEDPANLRPILKWNVSGLVGNPEDFTYEPALLKSASHHAIRWALGNDPLFLDYAKPTILHSQDNEFLKNPDYVIERYDATNGYVYLVIVGADIVRTPTNKQQIPAAHPVHLHGHDFVILQQSKGALNLSNPALRNPPRRDTALLYGGGALALAFKPDNPGIWLVHCHIAWHASSGLAFQILERQKEIPGFIGSLETTMKTCDGWRKMGLKYDQEDSGI